MPAIRRVRICEPIKEIDEDERQSEISESMSEGSPVVNKVAHALKRRFDPSRASKKAAVVIDDKQMERLSQVHNMIKTINSPHRGAGVASPDSKSLSQKRSFARQSNQSSGDKSQKKLVTRSRSRTR